MNRLTPGQRVRFFSRLNGNDLVLGFVQPESSNHSAWTTVVKYLSRGNRTVGTAFDVEAGTGGFRLKWAQDTDQYLCWWPEGQQLNLMHSAFANRSDRYDTTIFTTDPVESDNWLVLNNREKSRVVDVAGSMIDEDTPVLSWRWNAGNNQIWRTELA